jgi:putative heme-binding domain-containing protein
MALIRTVILAISLVLSFPGPSFARAADGLTLHAGFEITEFSGGDLANDIYCMTLDPKGRVIVSGRGYIRLLLGEQGRATRAVDFAGAPKDGAMGLFWEGDDLYCMGDGGLWRYRNASESGHSRPPELLYRFKTGGEHDAHAIRRGPDGWLYILCGNNAGIRASYATLPTSPIKEPVAGCMLRLSPDFKGCEIVADGFRNAYGFDFNSDGEWFTYDSDNERCVALPWYEPCRLYHVVPGSHQGWQNPQHAISWRKPPYFSEVTAPVATLGRGSPTGVICYRHVQFPQHYRDGLFLLDWTFGRVWFAKPTRSGSNYKAKVELFLEATGENGFAPTAGAVDPLTGDLYLSIGGRGTRGAVYRIRHVEGFKTLKLEDALALQPSARSLDWKPVLAESLPIAALGTDLRERRKAVELLRRHIDHFDVKKLDEVISKNLAQEDRGIRQAAQAVLATIDDTARQKSIGTLRDPGAITAAYLVHPDPEKSMPHAISLLNDGKLSARLRLDAVRLIQRNLGDLMSPKVKGTVWEGYSHRGNSPVSDAVRTALRAAFPSNDANLSRELSRTLAMIADPDAETLSKVTAQLRADSDPVEDIHYLIVAAKLRAERTPQISERIANGLLSLDRKIIQRKINRESNWPLRVGEMFDELVHKDPALPKVMLEHPEFGRPDHALFVKTRGFDARRAAEIFLKRADKAADFAWNAHVVEVLGELPPEQVFPTFRRIWGEYGLDDVILPILAKHPEQVDRSRFIKGLESPQFTLIRASLGALDVLSKGEDRDEILAIVLALRRLTPGKEEDRLAGELAAYLEKHTGQKNLGANRETWSQWFAKTYPGAAKKLNGNDGVDVEAWNKRFSGIDWNFGNIERGRAIFTKSSCASCHSGSQALGPDLRGVAGRFSRADLFTAIIQPSKDVSARYRTTQVTTAEGKTYQGIIIYEALDSLMLQTGPATTIRLVDKQIADRRVTVNSLMPVNLIDKLTDQEIADLYAYLRELK